MKFTASVVTAALVSDNNNVLAFTPSFVPRRKTSNNAFLRPLSAATVAEVPTASATGSSTLGGGMSMLVESSGGMEELYELTDAAEYNRPWAKQVRKSPTLFKIAGMATIPISAALGFGLVPSRRIVAHGVGAVLTGIAGAVGKSRLDALTEANAKPALAQAMIDVGSVTDDPAAVLAALQRVQDDFGIGNEDFAELCTGLYATYLTGMIKYSPTVCKTSEIKELACLKEALGPLDNLQVGEAHYQAATEWYRQTCLFTPTEELDDPSHPDRQAMDKFLFLTERALAPHETPQAFTFEMTRIAKAFDLTLAQAMERVAETAEPFYQRALKSTRSKLTGETQVNAEMLERARHTLGIAESTAADLHVACFNEHVKELLGVTAATSDEEEGDAASVDLSSLKFPDGATEQLEQLRTVLGLSEVDAQYEISLEATPLFQATALARMTAVLEQQQTPDEAWQAMEARRHELLLTADSSNSLMKSMVMQALGQPLERTHKFATVNNEAATYDNLLEALAAKQALVTILQNADPDLTSASFDKTFCDPWDKQSANGFLLSDERIKLYRIFLHRSIRKSENAEVIADATFEQIAAIQGLLGITDLQAEIEARSAFGPYLQKVLDVAQAEIVADYTPALAETMQTRVQTVLSNYRLSNEFLRELGASYYAAAVETISEQAPNGIPNETQSQALGALRDLLQLTVEETYPSHSESFGSVYQKSVVEAMGTTGVIRPEFRSALDDLKARLGLDEAACQELFQAAIEEKLVPMVKWVGSEMERTMLSQKELSQRRGKDMGQDVFSNSAENQGVLGLGAEVNIMRDIMELVDFYRENEVAYANPDSDDAEDLIYPVTALGTSAVDQQLAELLYRQFIVGGFQAQGSQAERYQDARDTFAGILGLEDSTVKDIKDNIASTVYDNLVTNALQTKGSMDQQDLMFLANIQAKLGLSNEQGEELLLASQTKVLSEQVNALMDESPIEPAKIKAFRERCNSMGVDLQEDVGISKPRLQRMLESELTPALKAGELTADDPSTPAYLQELQGSLGLEAEEAELMLDTLLQRLAQNCVDLISAELMRGRQETAVDLIKELVRYAQFTDDLNLNAVEEATGNQVLNIYEALDWSEDEGKTDVEGNLDLLRTVLGLSSS